MTENYIGCSGFYYNEWKDVFYPDKLPKKKWFDYYCQHFNTLEINSSFYKFPTEKTLRTWFDKSPPEFRFSVKAPRLISHYKKFNDCERLLSDFYNIVIPGLREKLGCILYQFPPQFRYSPERLSLLINSVDKNLKNVFEFRHDSWWNQEVFYEFSKHGLIFCGISYPGLPDEAISTAPQLYYRFHGVPDLYRSLYDDAFIESLYQQFKSYETSENWIYFDNTSGEAALKNAALMQKLFGG